MQLANTKQVRAIVRNYFGISFTGNSWTDVARGIHRLLVLDCQTVGTTERQQ